jgi:hypothetical protein
MPYRQMIEDLAAAQISPQAVQELKETRFVEGLIKGKTGEIAARDAGFGAAAQHTPGKIIPPEELRRRFQEIAREKGLTLHRIGDKIAEHLEARANQTLNGKEVTQSDAPDYKVQQKALEQLTTLIGMQDASKAQAGGSSITLSISGPAADRLAAMLGG